MDMAGVILGINLDWRQRWLAACSTRAGGCGLGVGGARPHALRINSLLRVTAAVRDYQPARGWTEEEVGNAPSRSKAIGAIRGLCEAGLPDFATDVLAADLHTIGAAQPSIQARELTQMAEEQAL
eukprot:9986617-Alexandrium_andersonii.AAC.1